MEDTNDELAGWASDDGKNAGMIIPLGVVTAVVADRDFASQVERMLEADFAKSRLMASGEYDARPWWFRFAVKLARLTAPVQ